MSWRLACAIAAAGGAAGCAVAGSGQGPSDAPGTKFDGANDRFDGPRSLDGPAATCTTSVTCATATVLAGIGGDEDGAATASASGYQAAWYSIRLSETDSGAFADPMSMRTTLTSPSGAMFDLLVYLPGDASSTDCTTPSGTVSTNGNSETSTLEWGETGTFANGDDDSRTVTIQISPHTGDTCSPTSTWSLSILTGFD